jgi:hypothetical protein
MVILEDNDLRMLACGTAEWAGICSGVFVECSLGEYRQVILLFTRELSPAKYFCSWPCVGRLQAPIHSFNSIVNI